MVVNFKNALQRVKVEKEALERIRSRSSVTYTDFSHPLICPAEEKSFSVHMEADFRDEPFRMSDGTLVSLIVFPNERDYSVDPFCVASDGRVFTFLDLPSMADRMGVVRHADAFLEERFRELAACRPLHAEIQRAYGDASPTREVVTGRYAEDFAGTVTWSRALDFARGSCESVYSGLRYMDFKDCTNVYALRASDGEAVSLDRMKSAELMKVVGDLRHTLAALAALKAGGKERKTKTLSEGGPLTREQLEYAFLPLHATDLPHRCADVLRSHGIENLAGVLALDRRQLDSVFSGAINKKDWLMSCLERHGLQDKFGLKMDSRFSMDVRDYDLKPGRPARRRGVPAKKAKPRTPGL